MEILIPIIAISLLCIISQLMNNEIDKKAKTNYVVREYNNFVTDTTKYYVAKEEYHMGMGYTYIKIDKDFTDKEKAIDFAKLLYEKQTTAEDTIIFKTKDLNENK